ncbi:hypothetical protein C2S51_026693 [Perilla frutescens var. frutescens]|nr:hypothetical protein C2S51_026693 [Perilla frutescens var. frutescens]
MAVINPKLCLLLLTLSLLLLPSLAYTISEQQQHEEEESPVGELFECFKSCGKRPGNDHEFTKCEQKCVDHYKERVRQEREESAGGRDEWSYPQIEEPRKVYERCLSGCDKQQGSKSQEYQCRRTCHDQYDEMTKHRRQERDCGCGRGADCRCGGAENDQQPPVERYKECRSRCGRQQPGQPRQYCEKRCQWELEKHGGGGGDVEERESRNNPYFFEKQRFDTKFRTEEGHIKVLQRFSKKSELLQGIENYRLAILEANPNTFVLPHHSDAESIFFVVGGKGTISCVRENERRSYNLKEGDVIRVPAGALVYLINRDDNQRLYVLKLLQPVNTPGKFKDYFGVGGENPESFYRTFSNEILEAAFNTPREKLEKLFRQQKNEGVIIRASKEQIKALSKESSEGRREGRWSPINVMNKSPLFSSKFGRYVEASPNDHDQLKDLDVAVGFMNIKKGGMIAPYYNSRSTKIAFVVGGSGYLEMACPHLSTQRKKHGARYDKVRARLSVGDAFVVPAGHPVAIVASGESELKLASFGINGAFNHKHFLAGKENVWKEVEREAKELTFATPVAEVEEILKRQDESYFVAGPQHGKSRRVVSSILDFVGF